MRAKLTVLTAVVGLVLSSAAAAQDDGRAARIAELDRTVRVSCEAGEHRGAVVLAIGGQVAYSHLCGEGVRADSRFKLQTTSQMITGLMIMRLVEDGVLELDAPVFRYVPDLPKGWRDVTVRHLLGQTSGIHDHTNLLVELSGSPKATDHAATMQLLFQEPDVARETTYRPPGAAYRMNRFGFDLLAHVAERSTGKSFAALMTRLVFEPAGMTDAGIEQAISQRGRRIPAPDDRLTPGWTREGGPERMTPAPVFPQMGAAGIYATTADLIALDRALAAHRVVRAETWKRMLTDRMLMHPSNPDDYYGLGLFIGPRLGLASHGHNGGVDGYISSFRRFPEQDAVVIGLFSGDWAGARWIEEAAAKALTVEGD